jgi:hypothetical protein
VNRETLEDYMAKIDAGKPRRCDWCVGFIRRDCDIFKRCVKQATDRSFS